jgi:hypothetical protein
VPTSLLPFFGAEWSAVDPHNVTASYALHATQLDIGYTLDDDARVLAVVLDRWGDPRNEGAWAYHPFGFEVTAYSTFDGVTIPSSGRAGWFYGSDRWSEGEFFRSEITGYELVAGPPT